LGLAGLSPPPSRFLNIFFQDDEAAILPLGVSLMLFAHNITYINTVYKQAEKPVKAIDVHFHFEHAICH
jgi:hypothetical protein